MARRVLFVVVDLGADADPLMLHLFAARAEKERAMISSKTKAPLQAAKAEDVAVGNQRFEFVGEIASGARVKSAADLAASTPPAITEIPATGATTLRAAAASLNRRGYKTTRGSGFSPKCAKYVLAKAAS